eukprot:SAG11_NODE_1043_length_6052_cov_7.005711_5_plen_105_part_00
MQLRSGSLLINKLILVANRFVSGFLDLPWQIQVHIGELVMHKRIVIRMSSISAEHRILIQFIVQELDDEFDECLDCGEHCWWIRGMWCMSCGGVGSQHPIRLLP